MTLGDGTWCGVTGCPLQGLRAHGHDGSGAPGAPTPPRPARATVTREAHNLPAVHSGQRQHTLASSCWCGPTVEVVHHAADRAWAPAGPRQVVMADDEPDPVQLLRNVGAV